METKESLRRQLRAERHLLSRDEVVQISRVITDNLVALVDWEAVTSVHAYVSRSDWGEVDTSELCDYLKLNHPGIRLTLSSQSRTAQFPTRQFDVIILPVLGFDRACNRLGMGAAWYDRFLGLQSQAQTIGLAYEAACVHVIPAEPHDISLDYVVTESAIYASKIV